MSQNLTEIGGWYYFLNNEADYLPYTILTIISSILGILGNLLIIGTVISNKDLHSSTNILIFNLAIADLIISALIEPFTLVGIFKGKIFLEYQNHILCDLIAAFSFIAFESSLMSITILAFNRYIHICHSSLYHKWFTFTKTLIYCVITWLIGICMEIPNLAGWSGNYYDEKTLACMWNRLASQSYSLFFPLISIVAPCIFICFLYAKIYLFIIKAHNKVAHEHAHDRTKGKTKQAQVATGLFVSYIIFTLCWLPYGIVIMADFKDKYPREVIMYTMFVSHLNSSLNPILYGMFNSSFQKGYIDFLRRLFLINKFSFFGSKSALTTFNHEFTH